MNAVIQFLAAVLALIVGLVVAVSMFPKEPIIDNKDKFPDGMA